MKTANEFEEDLYEAALLRRNIEKDRKDPYREFIFSVCSDTDLDDRENVIETINYLARECIKRNLEANTYEVKLSKLMIARDYMDFLNKTQDALLKVTADMMPDGHPFKEFVKKALEEDADDETDQE